MDVLELLPKGSNFSLLPVETRPAASPNHYAVMTLETLLCDQRVAEMSAALTKTVSVRSICATSIRSLSAAASPALRVAAGDDPSCSLG